MTAVQLSAVFLVASLKLSFEIIKPCLDFVFHEIPPGNEFLPDSFRFGGIFCANDLAKSPGARRTPRTNTTPQLRPPRAPGPRSRVPLRSRTPAPLPARPPPAPVRLARPHAVTLTTCGEIADRSGVESMILTAGFPSAKATTRGSGQVRHRHGRSGYDSAIALDST
jgi:hypothetical protein